MIISIIRMALSAVLLYFVYGETGWATTLALVLVLLHVEITAKQE